MQDREYQKALEEQQQQQQIINTMNINNNGQLEEGKVEFKEEKEQVNNERYFMDRMNMAKERINKLVLNGKLIKVKLRMPNGASVEHKFCDSDLVESLFDLALCHELKIDGKWLDEFDLVCTYPKKVLNDADKWKTLGDVGIEHSAMLHVQEKDI